MSVGVELQRYLGASAQIQSMERLVRELVEIPSGTADPAGLDRMEARLERELLDLGFEVSKAPGKILVARRPGAAHVPRVLLVGHLDTVYPPEESFSGLEERINPGGERMLVGPGAVDMKAGLVVVVSALHALRAVGALDRGSLTVLLNRDEETGSRASGTHITAESGRHDLAIVVEPGFDRPDGSTTVVVERAGLARVRLAVAGVEAHAGNQPERGLSAVATAARLVGPIDALASPGEGLLVKVCTFRGGKSINQVPGRAELGVDVRFQDLAQWEAVLERIRALAALTVDRNPLTGQSTRCEVEVIGHKVPMPKLPGTDRFLALLLEAAAELGQRLEPGRRNGTSDGNHTAAAGTPTLDGLGVVGVGMHVAGEEAVRASSIPERAALLACTLRKVWRG
jgi:glutamate carboxypeptidase